MLISNTIVIVLLVILKESLDQDQLTDKNEYCGLICAIKKDC